MSFWEAYVKKKKKEMNKIEKYLGHLRLADIILTLETTKELQETLADFNMKSLSLN